MWSVGAIGGKNITARASANMNKDEWRLFPYGPLTALLMGFVLVPILVHNINFPKVAAEAILAAIAGTVFLLYRYIERRKKL
jgi:hypothetical protein